MFLVAVRCKSLDRQRLLHRILVQAGEAEAASREKII